MEWIEIDASKLPTCEILAANFEKGSYGYKEKKIGYLSNDGTCIVCDSENEVLEDCTHYIDLNEFDIKDNKVNV